MKTLFRPRAWLPLVLVVGLTGCFDIGNTIQLNEDLSGKASVAMTVDMSAMVEIVAGIKKQMSGQEGPVTPAELEAARQEFVEEQQQRKAEGEESFDDEKRKRLVESLPEGVTLESVNVDESDPLKVVVNMTFAFDHVSKLAQIEMPSDEGAAQGPGPDNPIQKPFEGLVVEETEDSVTIRFEPLNPAKKEEPQPKEGGARGGGGMQMPGMEAMVENAMKDGLKLHYRIEAPFAVSSTNATKQEAGAVSWNYDFATLQKLEEDAKQAGTKPEAPTVTYTR